jgi:hypothetical protein
MSWNNKGEKSPYIAITYHWNKICIKFLYQVKNWFKCICIPFLYYKYIFGLNKYFHQLNTCM